MAQPRDVESGAPTIPAEAAEAFAPTVATPSSPAAPPSSGSSPAPVDPAEAPLEGGFAERYQDRHLLGAGGMGEVHLSRDGRIGRDVAVKVARQAPGSRGDAGARFAREARVQGQLEHPAVVPVYDLGRRPDGAIYFTMKRVRGVTLAQVVERLRGGDEALARVWSRRKLLTAFAQVCQAVHYAHARGVLHRDLKPANIMLGDYGEVYVLDWGLARLTDDTAAADAEPVPQSGESAPRVELHGSGGDTTSGAVMGTPGYMPPEQIRGDLEHLDARTDVFALGAILYELLTFEPLVPRGGPAEMLTTTLSGVDARASRRAPAREVPPELEAACVRATASESAARFASARELADAVDRYLDGDRDLARRRELAAEWGRAAEEAAEQALAAGAGDEARKQALARAGQALALDPENAAAMGTMVRLLLAPPARMPVEVEADLEAAETRTVRVAARHGGYAFLSWLPFVPLLWWLGLKDGSLIVPWLLCIFGMAGVGMLGARVVKSDMRLHAAAIFFSNCAIVLMAPIFGPFILTPVLASANTVAFVTHTRKGLRGIVLAVGSLVAIGPILAEYHGILPRSFGFADGALVIRSWMVDLPPTATVVTLCLSFVGTTIIPALYMARVRDALTSAERALTLQSWHLRQLIPAQARDAIAPGFEAQSSAPLVACPAHEWWNRRR